MSEKVDLTNHRPIAHLGEINCKKFQESGFRLLNRQDLERFILEVCSGCGDEIVFDDLNDVIYVPREGKCSPEPPPPPIIPKRGTFSPYNEESD